MLSDSDIYETNPDYLFFKEQENPQEQPSKGSFIPHELLDDLDLSIVDVRLAVLINRLDNDKFDGCVATNQWLANKLNVSLATIQRSLRSLKEKRWVFELSQNDDRKRRLGGYYRLFKKEYRNIDLCVNRRGVTHDRVGTSNLTPPPTSNLTPIITTNSNNLIKNIKKGQKGCQNTTHNPASGTPSSPEVDELQVYDLQFESFWDKVQYKAQKSKAYAQWKKATNNGKSQTAIKGIEEGYERYVSFLAKTKKLGFNQSHMLMSRFLNHKDQLWLEEWKTEEEQRQERNKEQQKQFFEAKQKEEQKLKEQQRNELEEEKKQHLIAITTKYLEFWSEVIKQRFGFDVTDNDIEQHQANNTNYWIYFEEWCRNRYIADTIGAFTKKGMDYNAIEERFDERIRNRKSQKDL